MDAVISEFFNFWVLFLSWLNSMYITDYVSLGSFLVVIAVLSLVIANLVLVAKR